MPAGGAGAAEDWTFVTRNKRGRLRNVRPGSNTATPPPHESSAAKAPASHNSEVTPNPRPQLTVDDIRRDHRRCAQEWRESGCLRGLDALLARHEVLRDDDDGSECSPFPDVATAICLGPGSFDPESGSWPWRQTSHWQVMAFLRMTEALSTKRGKPIQTFVQEPAFTPADKEFCAELGMQVLDSPRGFDVVDGDALVFGVHLYLETVHRALLGKALPAVFVGTALAQWDSVSWAVPSMRRLIEGPVEEMDAAYAKVPFPDPDLGYAFSNTTIHWRRRARPERRAES